MQQVNEILDLLQQFNCNGTVVEHPEHGEVIQLTGDQRNKVRDFLMEFGLAPANLLKVGLSVSFLEDLTANFLLGNCLQCVSCDCYGHFNLQSQGVFFFIVDIPTLLEGPIIDTI